MISKVKHYLAAPNNVLPSMEDWKYGSSVNRQPSTVNRQPSTVNRQPPTANRQPPTILSLYLNDSV